MLGSLDPEKAKGKIVVCLRGINARVEKGEAVLQAGGAGMVLANDHTTGNEIIADAHVLPATHISYDEGVEVFSYLKSTKYASKLSVCICIYPQYCSLVLNLIYAAGRHMVT